MKMTDEFPACPCCNGEPVSRCIRCSRRLETEEDLVTGICADCWKPEDHEDDEWVNINGVES